MEIPGAPAPLRSDEDAMAGERVVTGLGPHTDRSRLRSVGEDDDPAP